MARMTDKEQFLKMVRELPEDSSFEDILYHCYVVQKVTEGERAIERGDLVSHEEIKKRFNLK